MPEIPTRRQQPKPVPPQVPLPGEFPPIPQEILTRFPSAANWQQRLNDFWKRTNQAVQQVQQETAAQVNSTVIWTVDRFLIYTNNGGSIPMFALDDTGIRLGNVLVINTPGRKVYIGAGEYANDNTPFYIDTDGKFSLGANLTWDPDTATLTITGIINATSGTIGGFSIGADYIRDTANSFGLASTVTGGDDTRFWAGATFANRATAPFRITESGVGVVGGFTISASTLSATVGASTLSLDAGNARLELTDTTGVGYSLVVNAFDGIARSGPTGVTGLAVKVTGDALPRLRIDVNGLIEFGDGANIDTNLYRSAANTLKTDDALVITGAITSASLAGVGTRNVVVDAAGVMSAP